MKNLITAELAADISATPVGILANLVSPETVFDFTAVLIQIMIIMAIIAALRKIAMKLIDTIMRNRLTISIAQSERISTLEEKRLLTLTKLIKSIVSYFLYFIGIITILDMLGIKVTAILAGAGVLSLAVAFGAKSMIEDLMSGLFILLENQYAVGEYVKIGDVVGKVEEIGMKTTKIATYNGEILIISNGEIGRLINYSRHAQRGNVDVGVAYEVDIQAAIDVLKDACDIINAQYDDILDEKANVLGIVELADSAVVLRMTFTVFDWKQLAVERCLRRISKEMLDDAQIEIAYPKIQLLS